MPEHGFGELALARGIADAGYPDVSTNLFPRGVFDLVHYHLVTQRHALKTCHLEGPSRPAEHGRAGGEVEQDEEVRRRVRQLLWSRLLANRSIIHRWHEALAVMAYPRNVAPSLAELARLAGDVLCLAGDGSLDSTWYGKRAGVSAIYASTELYMTRDRSARFVETEQFLRRRLEAADWLGRGLSDAGAWLNFSGHATINVLRSKGVRI